jgi:putative phage-type endonuclease
MLTPAQIEERRNGIGGSDVPAVVGHNQYKTALDVYLEKIGEAQPADLSDCEAVHWGNVLEEPVAREYARREGVKVRRRTHAVVHPDLPFIRGNLDREVVGKRKVLEIKTTGFFAGRELGDEGSDSVPDAWLCQVHHYMLATGFREADIAALIGGQRLKIFRIPFDQDLADMLIERLTWFWRECVEKRQPPPPQTAADLARLYPSDDGGTVTATPEIQKAIEGLREANARLKDLEAVRKGLEFSVKEHLGDAATLVGTDGKPLATWKSQSANRLDQTRLKAEDPDVYGRYTTTSTSRVLRLK